jgi:adenylosuccinate lyase
MISRYTLPEIADVFSDESRMRRWLEIEVLATEAHAELGLVSLVDAKNCRANMPVVDSAFVAAVSDRERTTDHDVAAFVDVVQDRIGMPSGAWIHFGLTSTDIVDTAQCWQLRDAADLILEALDRLLAGIIKRAQEHRYTPIMGRTHGIHAEPTTFGAKLALFALQLDRDRRRMRAAREQIAVCKLSGAVGTYSNIDPRVEEYVAARIGLQRVPATQVLARDRHAEYLYACASIGTTLESLAVELRHLQRTEVGEVREGFKPGQKGSSAMPHKRNPISAETITGLSRVLRGNLQAGLQDVALWHERDISHSSAERVILPDSSILTFYVIRRMTSLIDFLEVNADRMMANIESSLGLVFSQPTLLALIESGMSRDDAYRIVQQASMDAMAWNEPLREVLAANPDVKLSSDQLDELFSLQRALRNADLVFKEVTQIQF